MAAVSTIECYGYMQEDYCLALKKLQSQSAISPC